MNGHLQLDASAKGAIRGATLRRRSQRQSTSFLQSNSDLGNPWEVSESAPKMGGRYIYIYKYMCMYYI